MIKIGCLDKSEELIHLSIKYRFYMIEENGYLIFQQIHLAQSPTTPVLAQAPQTTLNLALREKHNEMAQASQPPR